MSRNVCITAVEGQTGSLIADLLLSKPFASNVDSVVGLTLDPSSEKVSELESQGVKIVKHVPGRERNLVKVLKETGCDTICLIPPAHPEKMEIATELINAAKKANIPNVCLISSVGCDYADPQKHPRLREFIELEALTLASKGDTSTSTGHSPCVIR
jgi:nucleoside-diphosphate-sugar epimerase